MCRYYSMSVSESSDQVTKSFPAHGNTTHVFVLAVGDRNYLNITKDVGSDAGTQASTYCYTKHYCLNYCTIYNFYVTFYGNAVKKLI